MTNIDPNGYSVLRFGGASRTRACAELGVSSGRGAVLEARFLRARGGAGPDAMRPRFARDEKHVAAVLAAGGYPAMPR
jgi:hypothetical protein